MTHAALAPLIGPEFDDFLGASIGEDRNGTATARLTELIDALPRAPTDAIPSRTSAADLVALLPKRKAPNVRPSDSVFAATGLRETRVFIALSAFAVMMLIVYAISGHYLLWPGNSANPPSPRADDASTAMPRR
jgi:hypothetical protein